MISESQIIDKNRQTKPSAGSSKTKSLQNSTISQEKAIFIPLYDFGLEIREKDFTNSNKVIAPPLKIHKPFSMAHKHSFHQSQAQTIITKFTVDEDSPAQHKGSLKKIGEGLKYITCLKKLKISLMSGVYLPLRLLMSIKHSINLQTLDIWTRNLELFLLLSKSIKYVPRLSEFLLNVHFNGYGPENQFKKFCKTNWDKTNLKIFSFVSSIVCKDLLDDLRILVSNCKTLRFLGINFNGKNQVDEADLKIFAAILSRKNSLRKISLNFAYTFDEKNRKSLQDMFAELVELKHLNSLELIFDRFRGSKSVILNYMLKYIVLIKDLRKLKLILTFEGDESEGLEKLVLAAKSIKRLEEFTFGFPNKIKNSIALYDEILKNVPQNLKLLNIDKSIDIYRSQNLMNIFATLSRFNTLETLKLDLSCLPVDDEGLSVLRNSLSRMSLKNFKLNLYSNSCISDVGADELEILLKSQKSLKKLSLILTTSINLSQNAYKVIIQGIKSLKGLEKLHLSSSQNNFLKNMDNFANFLKSTKTLIILKLKCPNIYINEFNMITTALAHRGIIEVFRIYLARIPLDSNSEIYSQLAKLTSLKKYTIC